MRQKRLMVSALATAALAAGGAYLVTAAPAAAAAPLDNPHFFASYSSLSVCRSYGAALARDRGWSSWNCYPTREGPASLWYDVARPLP